MFGFREKIQTEYKRDRSFFWFRITENTDGSYNIAVNSHLLSCIKFHFPELEDASPTKWDKNSRYDYFDLWIPASNADLIDLSCIKRWAEFAGNRCLWITPSQEMLLHFHPDALDYCIAGDFNFDFTTGQRTILGDAEYKVKYGNISDEQKKECFAILQKSIIKLADLLPIKKAGFSRYSNLIFSSIPAETSKNNSFIQDLVYAASVNYDSAGTIIPTLNISKPQMKSLSREEKISVWKSIYETPANIDINLSSISGSTIVIIDDLYQSGTTMLAYADFLKQHGAGSIFGLSCVKSLRDSDNLANGGTV